MNLVVLRLCILGTYSIHMVTCYFLRILNGTVDGVFHDWVGIVFASIFSTALLGPWPVIIMEVVPRPHTVLSIDVRFTGLQVFC